ncbi:MAG: Flp pilus assembly complex ATPase component TadA [Burkholderiales bacterium]|nr:Flp pilus assembly complex ATPase component TadA [Burkholderiales bacterium]
MTAEELAKTRLLEIGLTPQQWFTVTTQQRLLASQGKTITVKELLKRNRFVADDGIQEAFGGEDENTVASEQILPLSLCRKYSVFPTSISGETLNLKTTKPLNQKQKQRLMDACSTKVKELNLIPTDLKDLAQLLFANDAPEQLEDLISEIRSDDISPRLIQAAIKLILSQALMGRASDIHLDKKPDPEAWISYRIDSELKQVHLLPESIMAALFTVLKSECGMDAANQRSAQDGRLSMKYRGRNVDFRVAAQPVVDGETLTLRILDGHNLPTLETVFPQQKLILNRIDSLIKVSGKAGGIVIISGATGSGKSTTQYTLANRFARDRINIITVEDPVEYLLPFARQIQIQASIKQQAKEMERSILRQDPDVLIFGEIRDTDSATTALAFAESGHLVLCTIHANSVVQTIERFMSMVDEKSKEDALYILAHHLKLAVHQKLARSLCKCAEGQDQKTIEAISLQVKHATHGQLHVGPGAKKRKGCPQCNNTGIKGRVAVHETLMIEENEHLRKAFSNWMIHEKFSTPEKLHSMNGVDFITRAETAQTLLNIGAIDPDVAMNAIGINQARETT